LSPGTENLKYKYKIMTDIYDIKDLLLWDYANLIYSLIFIILFVLAYFILFKKGTKQVIKQEVIQEKPKIKNIDYATLIQDLENNLDNYSSEEFYHKIDKILRLYLSSIWFDNIQTLTLTELEKIKLDEIFINLLKSIYFKEYAQNIEDNIELRKEFLEKLKNLVLNK